VQVAAGKDLIASLWKDAKGLEDSLRAARAVSVPDQHAIADLEHRLANVKAQLSNAQLQLGQNAEPIYANAPYVSIWDSHVTPGSEGALQMMRRIDFPPEGTPAVGSR
jgi:hypothetical protein